MYVIFLYKRACMQRKTLFFKKNSIKMGWKMYEWVGQHQGCTKVEFLAKQSIKTKFPTLSWFCSFYRSLTLRITSFDNFSPPIFFYKMSCRSIWSFLYMPSFLSFGAHFPLVSPLIVIHWRILKAFMSIFLHHFNSSLHGASCLHWDDINY
jgi:hypothetical protein